MYTQGINFFKYITPIACTDRLKIPLAHGWNRGKVFPKVVILKDDEGNSWPVKLRKVEEQVCFVDAGWLKFVEDNGIGPGYFLIFENVEEGGPGNVFSVVIFDEVTAQGFKGFQPDNVGPDDVGPSVQPSSSKDDSVNKEEERKSGESTELVEEADDEDDEEYEAKCDQEEESHTDLGRGDTSAAGGSQKRRRGRKDMYGIEIFESKGIPVPDNPYFVSFIKRRPNELHLPFNFIKDHKLKLPETAKIRDMRGREWDMELNRWEDGRVLYRGEMASFCRVNHIKKNNLYVCEFLYGDGGVLTIYLYKLA